VMLAGQPQPLRIDLGTSRTEAPAAPPAPPGDASAPAAPAAATLTWARAGGQTFEARTGLAEEAGREPAAWRSPALSGLEVHQVDAATVRDAQGATVFTRSGPDWKRGGDTISYLPVSELLFALIEAKADRFMTPEEARLAGKGGAGLSSPAMTFELKSQAGNETINVYPALAGGAVPARVSGRDPVLLLPAGKLKELQGKLADARNEKPMPPEKSPEKSPKKPAKKK
jgi:hypothetical protein